MVTRPDAVDLKLKGYGEDEALRSNDPKVVETLKERHMTHGDVELQSSLFLLFIDLIMRAPGWKKLNPVQKQSMIMEAQKNSRILIGDAKHIDHWMDKAGYASLAVSSIVNEKGKPYDSET